MLCPIHDSIHQIRRHIGSAVDELQFLSHIVGVFDLHRGGHRLDLSVPVMNKPVRVRRGGQRDHDLLSPVRRDTLPQRRRPANTDIVIHPRRIVARRPLHHTLGKDHIMGDYRIPFKPLVFGTDRQHIPHVGAVVRNAGHQRSGIVDLVLLIEHDERPIHHAVDLRVDIAECCRGQIREKPVRRGLGRQGHHRRASCRRLCRAGQGTVATSRENGDRTD